MALPLLSPAEDNQLGSIAGLVTHGIEQGRARRSTARGEWYSDATQ